ncbi:restriction endonuclease [Hoeflea prorocentri]|uniref:Restriction endonuclease n=1 Tax=Hoeflea prorocentri TaxID=1922333 RepID=A0A9X3ZIR0_9HYPH|nr:restriction endonuclease [Hoeflea prorocentri]MCY6382111.1 restriction endonuclease [Hoeflea prorocentri]MDA5399911.1 restriction endonuclease [Hoeflea prorocentri]
MSRRFIIEKEGLPNLSGMMLATVEALKAIGGSATIQELDEKVIEVEGVTEEEQSFPMPNDERRLKVNYYLAWARTYLRRGSALENSSRGVWSLTDIGANLHSLEQAQAIYNQVQEEEKQRARLKRREKKSIEKLASQVQLDLGQLDDEEESDTDWKSALLNTMLQMDPSAFERLAQRLLREAGFTKVEVRGKTGDEGIDGIGVLRVNLVSFQVYFQCKRWKSSVGSKEIRDFRGALQGRADKGLFITTGSFTSQASDEATRDGAIAIDLIDGDRLCELLKQYGLGVETTMIEKVDIKEKWFANV